MEPEDEVGDDGLTSKQRIFSRLLTSINPFSQFITREVVSNNSATKHWELDEKILQRHPDEQIKKEIL